MAKPELGRQTGWPGPLPKSPDILRPLDKFRRRAVSRSMAKLYFLPKKAITLELPSHISEK